MVRQNSFPSGLLATRVSATTLAMSQNYTISFGPRISSQQSEPVFCKLSESYYLGCKAGYLGQYNVQSDTIGHASLDITIYNIL